MRNFVVAYLLAGIGVAAYNAYTYQQGKPAFNGFTSTENAGLAVLETVFVWPFALYKAVSA